MVTHQIVKQHRVVLLQLAQQQVLIEGALHGRDQAVDAAALLGEDSSLWGMRPISP